MKRNYFLFSSILIFVVSVISWQTVYADDVPLKKGETGAGTLSMLKTMKTRSSLSTSTTYIPVSADLLVPDLIVTFDMPVGLTTVSVLDNTGAVVYRTVVDTYTETELVVPVDGLDSGNYTLKITYGTTVLIGQFAL